jgi:choline kinase
MNSDSVEHLGKNRITTALLLAAGKGSRLYPLTAHAPKCLTLVNETSILHRLLNNLNDQGFKRLVIITGHLKNSIIDDLGDNYDGISIEYIHNPLYRTTNNIYTLWMARHVMNEPFVLFESDLVLNSTLLDRMVYPNRMAIALMTPWLNGTTVSIDGANMVTEFQHGSTENYSDVRYKTVNIYSFSLLSWQLIIKQLNRYISEGIVNCYYENIFFEMIQSKDLVLESVSFDHHPWYEIDTLKDLEKAETLFQQKKTV